MPEDWIANTGCSSMSAHSLRKAPIGVSSILEAARHSNCKMRRRLRDSLRIRAGDAVSHRALRSLVQSVEFRGGLLGRDAREVVASQKPTMIRITIAVNHEP